MSVELQAWPYVGVQSSYTVRLVRYRVIYRGITSTTQLLVSATYEFVPPVGLINSEGNNLFIGNSI